MRVMQASVGEGMVVVHFPLIEVLFKSNYDAKFLCGGFDLLISLCECEWACC